MPPAKAAAVAAPPAERAGIFLRLPANLPALVGLFIQAAVIVWWSASIDARVDALQRSQADLAGVPAALARLDERSVAQSSQLDRLAKDADRRAAAAGRP